MYFKFIAYALANINAGLIGNFFLDITKNFLLYFQNNVFLKWTIPGFIFLLSILFISYGLTFKVGFIFSFSKKIIKLIGYLFKLFKFIKIPFPSLPQEKEDGRKICYKKNEKN